MNKINLKTLLALIALVVTASFVACKDDTPIQEPETELDDDGLSEEQEEDELLEQQHLDFEAGRFKSDLDTNNLNSTDTYVVLFKSSFQPPLAETIDKSLEDRETASMMHERNVKAKVNNYIAGSVREQSITEWFTVLSSGFEAELTPDQVKQFYRDDNVKCISKPPEYKSEVSPALSMEENSGLFVHGYKSGAGKSKRIWIVDVGPSTTHTALNVDVARSKSFGGPARTSSSHGTGVAAVAAAKEYGSKGLRGIAPGAKVVCINVRMTWTSINKALEYTFIHSKAGDPVNCSFGAVLGYRPKNVSPLILECENNLLDFEGYNQPVVIAAGNDDMFASQTTPARLGMKYKKNPSKYDFIFVVANVIATGTPTQIKNGTTSFGLNTYAESNYGRAIRYGCIGDWRTPKGIQTGTSFSAPALCGILYHQSPSTAKPKTYSKRVRHKKGKTTYYYRVPKL